MSATPLPGYTAPGPGGKKTNIVELTGPVSYSSGGQTLTAAQFGAGGFDMVNTVGLSYSGTYYGRVQYLAVDAAPSAIKGAVSSVKVLWIVAATNAEYGGGDLSTEVMRVMMVLV